MNFLRSKPLACFCLTYLVVSCLSVYVPRTPKLICAGIFLIGALLFGIFGTRLFYRFYDAPRLRRLFAVLFSCAFLASAASFLAFDWRAQKFADAADEYDVVTLEITDTAYTSAFGARYYATVRESTRFGGDFRIMLDSADVSLRRQDILTGTIRYRSLEEDVNGYNEKRYATSRKIMIGAEDAALQYEGRDEGFSFSRFFQRMNARLCNRIFIRVGTEKGGLAAALLLGNRSELPDSLKRDFRRLGMYHMLCLSGAHLSILTSALEKIMLKMRIGKKTRAAVNGIAVLFFMALTGFSSSITRAGLMLFLAYLAFFVRRASDYTTSLTFACALILAVNPYAALDYGLHLSFVAAHGCYVGSVIARRWTSRFRIRLPRRFRRTAGICNRLLRYLSETIVYNLIISVNMTPLMWLYFGELSLVSLPANLLYMPLLTLLMDLTLAYLLLYPLKWFARPLAGAISLLTSLISESAGAVSSLRGIVLPLNFWFTPIFVIPLVVLTAMAFSGKKEIIRKTSRISIGVFALFLLSAAGYSAIEKNRISVEYVAVGKNDGLLVKSGGHLLICEISDGSYTFASRLAAQRSEFNAAEIEAYMLTHYHSRHISSIARLTDSCIVRTLILPNPVTETDTNVYAALTALAAEKNIRILLTDRVAGDTVYFNDAEVETYPLALLSRSSHPVVAVRLSLGETSLMYLGGSFNKGGAVLSERARLSDYLIFGGHNPVYKTAPDVAVFAEAKAAYASDEVLKTLEELSPGIAAFFSSSFSPGVVFHPESENGRSLLLP